jgi:hypothetical protein
LDLWAPAWFGASAKTAVGIFAVPEPDGNAAGWTALMRLLSAEATRLDPERTESRDQPIRHAEIGCAAAGTIHDQELMFDENRLGNYRTQTSGSGEPQNGGEEMNQENNQIVHIRMVATEEDSGFWANLEFARLLRGTEIRFG